MKIKDIRFLLINEKYKELPYKYYAYDCCENALGLFNDEENISSGKFYEGVVKKSKWYIEHMGNDEYYALDYLKSEKINDITEPIKFGYTSISDIAIYFFKKELINLVNDIQCKIKDEDK
jgi:hypothetical protein